MSFDRTPGRALVFTTVIAFGAGLGPGAVVLGATSEPLPNLICNPSFEEAAANAAFPAHWQGASQIYSVHRGVSRSGQASLKYVNQDPQRYVLCTQKFVVQPGWKCRVSGWIKTQGIVGKDSGAAICLEWQGPDGKLLGGVYPTEIKATRDWTRVEAVARAPEDAASCLVACYVRKQMAGTAWFDDVEVFRIADPLIQTVLITPNYRGWITAAGPQNAGVRVRWNLVDDDVKPQDVQFSAVFGRRDGVVLRQAVARPTGGPRGSVDLQVPLAGLEPGDHELSVRLEGPGGKELWGERHPLVRLPDAFRSRCAIDEHRRLLVDGKPFFFRSARTGAASTRRTWRCMRKASSTA